MTEDDFYRFFSGKFEDAFKNYENRFYGAQGNTPPPTEFPVNISQIPHPYIAISYCKDLISLGEIQSIKYLKDTAKRRGANVSSLTINKKVQNSPLFNSPWFDVVKAFHIIVISNTELAYSESSNSLRPKPTKS